jgi:NAD(P)-dependent dehydrogenase (short-subunit alcohol dehydrogenase family)
MERARRIASFALGVAAVAAGAALTRRAAYLADLAQLHDRIVVIVGGTRGLGFALARELAGAGAHVTIAGRDEQTVRRAQDVLAVEGLDVAAMRCDARDPDDAAALIARVEERSGSIDVLLNVLGVIQVGSVWDQRLDDFHESVDTHVFGPLHTMRAVLPSMRARRAGRIANVASVGGLVGVPHLGPYSAGKFGLVGLSQAYAAELARDGITVTTICPGLMRTGSPDNADFKGRTRAEYGWFAISDANPLVSVSTGRAVRAIVRALVHRKPFVTIGFPARAAMIVNALAPSLTTRILGLVARVLPPPLEDPTVKRPGRDSHSPLAPSILTALDQIAKRRNNE